MAVDARLLEVLTCPVSKVPVARLGRRGLAELNRAIAAGEVQTVAGTAWTEAIGEALITTDRKVIYRVDDGIPVMLPDEGIGTTQFTDFPTD